MDLVVVVTDDLIPEHRPNILQLHNIFQGAGADDPILQPAIRSLDLAFGLRGKGIGDIHVQQTHHLPPLSVDIICLEHVLAPDTISSLHKAEDTQRINIVTKGQSEVLNNGSGSLNMSPGSLGGEEISKKDLATVIIDGCDQSPFLFGTRRPAVGGTVMLDQSADRSGQDLPVMRFPLLSRLVASQLLCSVDDGVE